MMISLLTMGMFFSFPLHAKSDQQKVVIAHRGASGYLPEHTLAGVTLAHGLGADYIEPDVVLTKDNIPIVLHDIHLDSTSNVAKIFPHRKRADKRWYAIDFTVEELKSLRAHERVDIKTERPVYPRRFQTDAEIFDIPTLEEWLQIVQGLNKTRGRIVGIYPELKSPEFHRREGKDIAKIVVDLLATYGYKSESDPIYLQSFDPKTLRYVRSGLNSKLKLVQLIGENSPDAPEVDYLAMQTERGLKEIATYAQGIGPSLRHVVAYDKSKASFAPTNLVTWAHQQNLVVHPYTVRADELPAGVPSINSMLDVLFKGAKVDGVFTDFPDLVVRYLGR